MSIYRVWYDVVQSAYMDVEASSEDEAYNIARDAGGDEFVLGDKDWQYNEMECIVEDEEEEELLDEVPDDPDLQFFQ